MTMAENRSLDQVTSNLPEIVQLGVDGGTHLYQGSFAAPLSATGMLAVGGGVAACNAVMGVASAEADNSLGDDGALSVNLAQGVFRRKNSATSPCVAATAGQVVYAEDGETVRIAAGATYPVAGIFLGFEADGTTPLVFTSAVVNYLLSQGTLETQLAAITNGLGASKIGIEDAATNFTAANVEAALAEIMTLLAGVAAATGANLVGFDDSGSKTTAATVGNALDEIYIDLTSAYADVFIPFDARWTEIDGTALADFSGGTTPGFDAAGGLRWEHNANPDPVHAVIQMPWDLNNTADITLSVVCAKTGATGADATTFDVGVYNVIVGALYDADSNYGNTTAAITGNAAAKTVQEAQVVLDAADLPDADAAISLAKIVVQPTDGTLGTDDMIAFGIKLRYRRKLRTS